MKHTKHEQTITFRMDKQGPNVQQRKLIKHLVENHNAKGFSENVCMCITESLCGTAD